MIDKMIEEMLDLYNNCKNAEMLIGIKQCVEIAQEYKGKEPRWISFKEREPEHKHIGTDIVVLHKYPNCEYEEEDECLRECERYEECVMFDDNCKHYFYMAEVFSIYENYSGNGIEVAWIPLPEYTKGGAE